MKRLMPVCIMVLCLVSCLICVTAKAVDWEQYAMPSERDVWPSFHLSNGDEVSFWKEDSSLRWIHSGDEVARLTLDECLQWGHRSVFTGQTRVVLRNDGNLGVMLKGVVPSVEEGDHDDPFYAGYGIWNPDSFTLIWEWVSEDGFAVMGNQGFLTAEPSGQAVLYDLDAQIIWQGSLGQGSLSRPWGLVMRSPDDWMVAVLSWNTLQFACCRYLNGQMLWIRETMDYPAILPLDGGWGLIAEERSDGKNGPCYLSLIDSEGIVAAARQVTADRLSVTSGTPFEDEDGTVVIYGRGIGNRRRIYLVWRLRLDSRMNFISLDVRNCRYHNCYSIGIHPNVSGTALIHLSDYEHTGDPDVLVPFEAFPEATNHTLQYTWGSPHGDDAGDWDVK